MPLPCRHSLSWSRPPRQCQRVERRDSTSTDVVIALLKCRLLFDKKLRSIFVNNFFAGRPYYEDENTLAYGMIYM